MAASKLGLYNAALRLIGERSLASLTEAREPRRALDEIYDGALAFCLEQGQWNFATRSIEATPTASIDPGFGYVNAFLKPDDWVRTVGVCTDAYFREPLLEYTDEAGYWWSDLDDIFIRYVSNGANYGGDLSKWPASYQKFVELYMAVQVCPRLTSSESKSEVLKRDLHRALIEARSRDAMNEASVVLPAGSWVRSRVAGFPGRRYDRA